VQDQNNAMCLQSPDNREKRQQTSMFWDEFEILISMLKQPKTVGNVTSHNKVKVKLSLCLTN
jgi:hypothetical protein